MVDVSWEDASRSFGSCLGSNISDWTLVLKDGTVCPVIRNTNYQDKTATIKAKDISLIVGNHKQDGNLEAVTFQNYLENVGKYTNDLPDDTNLSLTEEDLVTIRFIAVIVPEDKTGSCEVVPTAYNYGTRDKKDPQNFVGASFHLGVGLRTDGTNAERVYLVKNSEGEDQNMWFKLTNKDYETKEQASVTSTVLGTRSTGVGRNRVQCFQIPRKQDRRSDDDGAIVAKGSGNCAVPIAQSAPRTRGCRQANVSYGSIAGKHQMEKLSTYDRQPDSVPTITFAYYYSSCDGIVSDSEAKSIIDTLEKDYQDTKTLWVGSLVTGGEKGNPPPITLNTPSKQDETSFVEKVNNFPKNVGDVQNFPV